MCQLDIPEGSRHDHVRYPGPMVPPSGGRRARHPRRLLLSPSLEVGDMHRNVRSSVAVATVCAVVTALAPASAARASAAAASADAGCAGEPWMDTHRSPDQ